MRIDGQVVGGELAAALLALRARAQRRPVRRHEHCQGVADRTEEAGIFTNAMDSRVTYLTFPLSLSMYIY